jgi:hypothetical protein
MEDVKELQRQVESLRRELRDASQEFIQEGRTAVREGETLFKNVASPGTGSLPQNKIDPNLERGGTASPALSDANPLPRALDVPDDPEV